jgi:hypothetical protein
MNTVYRVAWKSKSTGKWKYVNCEDVATILGEREFAKYDPSKPLVFTDPGVAEHTARAMTDKKDVLKVVLRREDDSIELDGAAKEGT